MKYFALAIPVLLVGCSSSAVQPTQMANVEPATASALAAAAVQVRCSIMIDFPGAKMDKFKELYDGSRLYLSDGLDKLGEFGMEEGNVRPYLFSKTLRLNNDFPELDDVRLALDEMVNGYNALGSKLQFKPLKDATKSALSLAAVPNRVPHYAIAASDSEALDAFYAAEGSNGLSEDDKAEIESARIAILDAATLSCVRYVWVDGRLLAIHNYLLSTENAQHEPTKREKLDKAEPRFCAVAEFWVDGI